MAIRSLFVVILAAAMTQPASATQPAAEPSCSGTQDQRSLLSNMLLMTGFSEACVATALDVCSSGQTQSPYASLIEEAREVVQQVSAAVAKWDSQLTTAVTSMESHLSTAVSSMESHLSTAVSSMESHLTTAVSSMESHLSTAINKSESELSAFKNTGESLPRHCSDLKASGDHGSGPRQVYPDPARPFHSVTVVCDHTVDGGGWTVFQRRTSDAQRQDFKRTWREYEDGFGDTNGEFWLGLKVLHLLTSSGLHQLRIDLHDYEGEHRWAKYGRFIVNGPETNYRLTVDEYSGDAGNSLAYHNGKAFTTYDADHDTLSSDNCAARHSKGGWWYGGCQFSNLNGDQQHVASGSPVNKGITWDGWRDCRYSLQGAAMMTRPA